MEYEPVIGLEVHAQLLTKTKIFCGCSTRFGEEPNSNTCPVCLGMPGVLPVLNKTVVAYAMKMALATHCTVHPKSTWARKNYFYPDLPKGYQITQFAHPLAEGGYVDIEKDGGKKRIGITRIHMEEDAGKSIHDETSGFSYVDLNRAAVPLIEIVSEPDMRSPEEAAAYLRRLHEILVYLEICDGNMEEGSFRCDANISLRPKGQKAFGIRSELKNMNSFRNVQRALEYEIERQSAVLEGGGTVIQETRLWDVSQGATFSMRGKEEAHDYRYFPEPDMVPFRFEPAWIDALAGNLPELPDVRRDRYMADFGLRKHEAAVLSAEYPLACYFEEAVSLAGADRARSVANWMLGEIAGYLNAEGTEIGALRLTAAMLAELVSLIEDGTISGKQAKEVFADAVATGDAPGAIVEARGMKQVSDTSAIEAVVRAVIDAHPDEAASYRGGKAGLLGFFVGQVMREMRGQGNPAVVNEVVRRLLG